VTFDWEPTLRSGAAALAGGVGPRGTDARLDIDARVAAADRLAGKRSRHRRGDGDPDWLEWTDAEPTSDGSTSDGSTSDGSTSNGSTSDGSTSDSAEWTDRGPELGSG
jgi:hypothetical protein